jgi:succinoglycan biosynthesis transport protein ExoP
METWQEVRKGERSASPTTRDLLAMGFRHRAAVLLCFLLILGGVLVYAVLFPKYAAHVKFLVKRERIDPVVSPAAETPLNNHEALPTEEQLNSEVELLNGWDIAKKAVVTCGLDQSPSILDRLFRTSQKVRTQRAADNLARRLNIHTIRKTDVIEVGYESRDPELSARVLNTLSGLYLEKHNAVSQPEGAFEFFDTKTEEYRKSLVDAEHQLSEFTKVGAIAGQQERDAALQKYTEFDADLRQTQVEITQTEERIGALESQAAASQSRMTTQVKTVDSPLRDQLRATLLDLERKRTGLLLKFKSSYPMIQEVDTEIVQTRAAIADSETMPVREETTDQDPAHEWVREELFKARAELSTLRARKTAAGEALAQYRRHIQRLADQQLTQSDLLRTAKANEDNYLLYQHKREEARISDALNKTSMINVKVAEAAAVPVMRTHGLVFYLLVGLLLASAASIGLLLVLEYMNPFFRTPDEAQAFLDVPILAAVPKAAA